MARDGARKDERKANRRGAARLAAGQALYPMEIARPGANDLLAEFESHWIGREGERGDYLPADAAVFRDRDGQRRTRPDRTAVSCRGVRAVHALTRRRLHRLIGEVEVDLRLCPNQRIANGKALGLRKFDDEFQAISSSARWYSGTRSRKRFIATAVTSRAIWLPRQKCLPAPKPRWPCGRRSMS